MNPLLGVLAVWRLTKLVTDDEITRPLREKVVLWSDQGKDGSLQDRVLQIYDPASSTLVQRSASVSICFFSRIAVQIGTCTKALFHKPMSTSVLNRDFPIVSSTV